MLPEELQYPAAYHDGHACLYERTAQFSKSYFGGPPDYAFKFSGNAFGTRPIHHVMTLYWDALPGIEKKGFSDLPLFYGIRYGGCCMKYEIVSPQLEFSDIEERLAAKRGLPNLSDECQILEMEPTKSSEDWPYVGYPELVPYVPLRLTERVQCSPEDFQGLILHGDEVKPEEVTVVIPPMFDLGISLFGPNADAEGLQLVFRCNLENKKRTIKV